MPHYLIQASYSSEAARALVGNPQDRSNAVRPVIESLGGKLISVYMAFGEHDTIAIVEMPDNASAAAFAMAAAAGGGISSVKTTPLLTIEEGVEAMRKAGGSGYSPPY
jgi:uncharacterized protein with GYD domain